MASEMEGAICSIVLTRLLRGGIQGPVHVTGSILPRTLGTSSGSMDEPLLKDFLLWKFSEIVELASLNLFVSEMDWDVAPQPFISA